MVNIVGSSLSDVITVINDLGTRNGTVIGTPIVDIKARSGADDITLSNSTITGEIRAHGDNDNLVANNTTMNIVRMGSGDDTIDITASTANIIHANAGNDTFTLQSSNVGEVSMGGGDDEITVIDTDISGVLSGNTGTDTLVIPAGTQVADQTHGTFTVVAGTSYDLSSGQFVLPTGQTISYATFEHAQGITCFVKGTKIKTHRGLINVENLLLGDMVHTYDNGPSPIRWIGSKHLQAQEIEDTPNLAPIRIQAGALGPNSPSSDLYVSAQHRLLLRSRVSQRMFGCEEILVPAVKLIGYPGISRCPGQGSVTYYHILCDRHQILMSNNACTESFYPGPLALQSLNAPDLHQVLKITGMPGASAESYPPARMLLNKNTHIRRLLERHKKNRIPLIA